MVTDLIIPTNLWEEDEDAVITTRLVSNGATVEEGALIAEIMTAKARYEIYAAASGTVSITGDADAVVPKGAVIGTIL